MELSHIKRDKTVTFTIKNDSMSKNITMEELEPKEVTPTSEVTEKVEEVVEKVEAPSEPAIEQDPLKTELERVQKTGRTELEKAQFSLKKNAERLKELGGDPNSVLGIEHVEEANDEDDQPVTVGMLKKLQQQNASKTAIQQAEEITNETERELVKYHLNNSIKSTGSPTEDLKLARALVNAVKNSQIIEEVARKSAPKTHSNASGAPAKDTSVEGELTADELAFTKKPFNMSKESILKLRTK